MYCGLVLRIIKSSQYKVSLLLLKMELESPQNVFYLSSYVPVIGILVRFDVGDVGLLIVGYLLGPACVEAES